MCLHKKEALGAVLYCVRLGSTHSVLCRRPCRAVGNGVVWCLAFWTPGLICVHSGNNKLRVHGLRRFKLVYSQCVFYCSWLGANWRWKCICPSHRSSIIIMPNPRHWSYPRWVLPPHDDRNRKEPMYWDLLWWEGLNLELSCMQRSPCYQFYLLQCYDAEVDAGVRRDRDSFRLRRWG